MWGLDFLEYFLLLVWLHLLLDFPLQGDFLSKAKNEFEPIPGVYWLHALWAHCFLQAGAVAIVTGSLILGFLEFCAHCVIDRLKTNKYISFGTDQVLHIACKLLWTLMVFGNQSSPLS